MPQGEQRSSNYALTYDSAKNFPIDIITSLPLLPAVRYGWIPGVSTSTTRWPSSSNSLDARISWSRVVSRRDPLTLFTNYSCNRLSLKINHTDCSLYRGFPTLDPSYHTRSKGWPSQTLHGKKTTYAISAGGSLTCSGVKPLAVDGIPGSPMFERWTGGPRLALSLGWDDMLMWMQQQGGEYGRAVPINICAVDKTRVKCRPAQIGHRPCSRRESLTPHNGQATLSNHNFDVQSGTRWKALESGKSIDRAERRTTSTDPTTTRDMADVHQFITVFDGQPTLSPPFPH